MGKTLIITPPIDILTDTSITRADLNNWFTNAVYGGVDRDHFASGTSPVVASATAPTSPATGLGWFNTGTGVVSFWSGSEWVSSIVYAATAPSGTGTLWYDTTLQLMRRYETRNGLAGWHPISPDAVLRDTSSNVTVNLPVFANRAGGVYNGDESLNPTPTGRLPRVDVVGIAAETVTISNPVVVWINRAGVVCDIASSSSMVAGDILCADYVGGAISVGPESFFNLSGDGVSFGFQQGGNPAGAFARVITSHNSSTNLAKIEMLGFVGSGRYVQLLTPPVTLADLSTPLVFDDLSQDVAISQTQFISSKHIPYAIRLQLEYDLKNSASGDRTITFSRTSSNVSGSNIDSAIVMEKANTSAVGEHRHTVILDIPTNDTQEPGAQSYGNGHGLFISYAGTACTPATDFNTLNLKMLGYYI